MTGIIDYDAGNIRSVEQALAALGEEAVVTRDAAVLKAADRVILPGVGAFGDCMQHLNDLSLVPVIRDIAASGKPFLGICLGLQLLFEESEESPGVAGLRLLPGSIRRIPAGGGRKIPHMGWNTLSIERQGGLFAGVPQQSCVYFVHSYYVDAADKAMVTAGCDYGAHMDVAVQAGNIYGVQFHPEKSSQVGLHILKNFLAR